MRSHFYRLLKKKKEKTTTDLNRIIIVLLNGSTIWLVFIKMYVCSHKKLTICKLYSYKCKDLVVLKIYIKIQIVDCEDYWEAAFYKINLVG